MTQTRHRLRSALANESRAQSMAIAAGLVSGLIALFVFAGRRVPLSGAHSVGELSSLISAGINFVVFCFAYQFSLGSTERPTPAPNPTQPAHPPTRVKRSSGMTTRLRRIFDVAALAFVHAAISFLTFNAVFFLFQDAFLGLDLDRFASALFVALSCGVSAYVVYLSGTRISTNSLSSLLVVFMSVGALTAMISTDNPHWWQTNFSILGSLGSGSAAYTFNLTLVLSGAVVVILASYVTRDLQRWRQLSGRGPVGGVRIIRGLLVFMGVCLATVGIIQVDLFMPLHNTAAITMIVAFGVLVIGIPFWLHELPQTFVVTSLGILGVLGLAVVLFFPLRYYNLTGLELAAGALIFGWLVIFIRNIAALLEDIEKR